MKRPAFGRESTEELINSQKELIEYIKNNEEIDPIEFAIKYNRATLGLLKRDVIIDLMVRYQKTTEFRPFLLRTIPQILRYVLRQALRYRGELSHFRDIPQYDMREKKEEEG